MDVWTSESDSQSRSHYISYAVCRLMLTNRIDVDGGLMSVLGKHDDAVSALEWCDDHGESAYPHPRAD